MPRLERSGSDIAASQAGGPSPNGAAGIVREKQEGIVEQYDVVIVGGGIAGPALAGQLAPAGLSVLLLERQVAFLDRVRGEYMQPWGAAELQRLGLEETILEAGGGYNTTMVGYDEDVEPSDAQAVGIPLGMLLPNVGGGIAVGHPQACEALLSSASERGATVRRGVADVDIAIDAGGNQTVEYQVDGVGSSVRSRIVVGADGRHSTVRRAMGLEFEQVTSGRVLGGLLVRSDEWPADRAAIGTEGDVHYLIFPRPDGYVRLYIACEKGARTSGADRGVELQQAFRLGSIPGSDSLAGAEPAGPCAYVAGSDTWTSEGPMVDGAVLVGDAAGWSDPIIGQGLSVALRDARSVADILLADDDWSSAAFEPYVVERAERMRRLRIGGHLQTEVRATFTPEGRARRAAFRDELVTEPMTVAPVLALLTGPETAPPEAFDDANVERILSLA
jgi:2-polyprenyl-6-methoxyphenol hydroxylase-like FAD-dependent oxidoreductase